MKKILCVLVLILLFAPAHAEEVKSLPIDLSGGYAPKAACYLDDLEYEDSTIHVTVREYQDTLDGQKIAYWVADVTIADASQLRTQAAAADFSSTRQLDCDVIARRVQAVVAINGDYYNGTERKQKAFTIRQGVLYRDNLDPEGKGSKLMDVLLIDENGDFHGIHQPTKGTLTDEIDGKKVINSFSFGPILVENGVKVEDFSSTGTWMNMAWDRRAQRMCICQVGPLHYKLICCMAPTHGYIGMSLDEFAAIVEREGVDIAYNLDGGDSTYLYFHGRKINNPRSSTTRKLQDIIYFASAEPEE